MVTFAEYLKENKKSEAQRAEEYLQKTFGTGTSKISGTSPASAAPKTEKASPSTSSSSQETKTNQDYLRQREKRTKSLMESGMSEKAAREQATKELRTSKESGIINPFEAEMGMLKEELKSDSSMAGLDIEQMTPEQIQQMGLLGQIGQAGIGQLEKTQAVPSLVSQITGVPQYVDVPIGIKLAAASAAFGASSWAVGGISGTISNPVKAVQLGTAAKNAKASQSAITKLRDASVALFGILGAAKYGSDIINMRVDDQQQALNTLGQITSTIVGDSMGAAGDWRKGLEELDNIEKELLKLESDIKSGTIKSIPLKIKGEIIDINADIYDQLATIQEGKRDIQSFVLTQSFPELSDLEIQNILRELEDEGYIEPVDLTTSRRKL